MLFFQLMTRRLRARVDCASEPFDVETTPRGARFRAYATRSLTAFEPKTRFTRFGKHRRGFGADQHFCGPQGLGSILLGHLADEIHRVLGRLRRAHLGIQITAVAQAAEFLEDERVIDLAGAGLEPAWVVADLHELD